MKRLLNMTAMIYLSLPSLWADEYDIWELEYDSVFSKCMAKIVEFPGHKIVPPLHTYEDEEDRISGEQQFASEGVEGSIDAYLRSKPIAQNVSIDKDLSKIYQHAIEHIDDEKDSPFLGVGQDYLFFNKQKRTYYCCFVEWDERFVKWNRGEDTWNTRMFPGALDFLNNIPRIHLTPLTPIGNKVFLMDDISVIVNGSALPHAIDKKATKPWQNNRKSQ